jgi:hypothetical protein
MALHLLTGSDSPHHDVVRVESPQREVVEVVRDDVPTLLVVEPVLVTPGGLGVTLASLTDVGDTADVPVGSAMVLYKDAEGVFRFSALAEAQGQGFRHTQAGPTLRATIVHDLPFTPAGVRCTDTLGQINEPEEILVPQPGVIEVVFGAPFSGVIELS